MTKQETASILVIDDEPGLRDMLRFGLTKRGYRVTAVSSGEEALVKAAAERFDVAICDVMMPGMNGVDTARGMKERSPETAVIMATGFATIETAIESMKSGAFDYITKPYGLSQLCTLIEKALEWRRLQARINHLEELHRLKDEFLSTISHELRTPITVILGYAGLLQHPNYSPAEISKGLGTIESKAKGLLRIVNNILDWANTSAKDPNLTLEICSMSPIVKEVIMDFKPVAESKSLTLTWESPENLSLETDRCKLKQILVNIVDNALKFTAAGHVAIRIEPADDHVKIEVEDTGIGIDPAHINIIFEEFRQIDQSRTRKHGGTGLGLAVTDRFVKLLGGRITVDSRPDKGSTFTVFLPGRKMDEIGQSISPQLIAPVHPNLLLVVDDDPGITRLFADFLTRDGYTVSTASGGWEALSRMSQRKPDVVLLDLMMPDIDGFDVMASIAANPALEGVRIFILTAKELTAAERSRLLQRAELIIQKGSIDLPEILALINHNLKSKPLDNPPL